MKITQRETNPFPYSDTNKRYHTYDYFMKHRYGAKCAKIPLDGGFTCPNIDGRCGTGGCIYCSGRGSGDFAQPAEMPISEQFEITAKNLSSKWKTDKYIAYFQAHTNTYAPVAVLREKFGEALKIKGVVGLNVATRADCLPPDVVEYLAELSEQKNVHYLDVASVIKDENGSLPPKYTSDGLHIGSELYIKWFDYLKTHAVTE